MKLKRSDVNIILMLAGILIAAGVYFFVYTKLNEMTETLNTENTDLQKEVDELQRLADHKQQYIDETEAMLAEIDEIKAQFPAAYKPEDDILYVRSLERDFDAYADSMTMGNPTVIEVAVAATPQPASEDGAVDVSLETTPAPSASSDVLLYRTPLTATMLSSYNSIKDIIKKINTDSDRKSIEQIALTFDSETGDLNVTLGFNAYSLSGTEKIYTEPDIGGIKFGSGNIFNSAEKKQALQDAQDAAAAAEEGADEEGAGQNANQ